jgi:hypothetical protein
LLLDPRFGSLKYTHATVAANTGNGNGVTSSFEPNPLFKIPVVRQKSVQQQAIDKQRDHGEKSDACQPSFCACFGSFALCAVVIKGS